MFASTAHGDNAEAERLFQEGRTLADTGKYVEACDRFAKSLAIERTIGTEINLANCHEQLGHFREAWGLFVAAAGESEAAGDSRRAAFARDRATALEPKMTTMIVKVAQPDLGGLVITISGRAIVPAAEIHEHADPGAVDVIATAPNLPHVKRSAVGEAGKTLVIEIPRLDGTIVVDKPPDKVAIGMERDPARVRITYVLIAGAGAALVTSIALTVVARNHYNQVADGANCDRVSGGITCNPTGEGQIHDAQHLADYGTIAAIGGGLLLGGAVITYLTAAQHPIYAVTPTATALGGLGLAISGSF